MGLVARPGPPQQSPLWTSPGVTWSWPILDANRPLGPAHYDIHLSSTSSCTPSVEEIFTPPPLRRLLTAGSMSEWRDEINRKALARLDKALPEVFPPPVLTHAMGRRFTPPMPRLAIDSYWRAHPVRADRLARALAAKSGAPAAGCALILPRPDVLLLIKTARMFGRRCPRSCADDAADQLMAELQLNETLGRRSAAICVCDGRYSFKPPVRGA